MSDKKFKFQVGDPIWAKMQGSPPWPSRIAAPHESPVPNNVRKPLPHHLVYFFGSNNFAWMPEEAIKPYEEFKAANSNPKKKTPAFKKALKAIDEYIEGGGKATLSDPPAEDDIAGSPSTAGDSLSNDASNADGLPSIDDEIAAIQNQKPIAKASKDSHDSPHDHSSSLSPAVSASVQRDYSRTPFKSRKSAKSDVEPTTETTSPTKRFKANDDNYGVSSLPSPTIPTSKPATNRARAVIMNTMQHSELPILETPQINLNSITAKHKDVNPSKLKFGFIGLGMMGQRILKHLLDTGHQVTVWNRNRDRLKVFEEVGAIGASVPCDVVSASDITFSCVSDAAASKELLFGQFGILKSMSAEKAYVELSSIDPETSNDISDAIISNGGRFLAAPIIYSGKSTAETGDLIVVASGDKPVFQDCRSCFQAISKRSFYLGSDCGDAARMQLIFSSFFGAIVGSLAECIQMISRFNLNPSDFKEILKISSMHSPLAEKIAEKMIIRGQDVDMPLSYLQKDLRMMLNLSEEKTQPCPITAAVNEVAKSRLFGDEDVCALLYNATRGI